VVVVDGEAVVIVVGGGVELVVVVESVLVVFVDAVVFWHPMIEVIKTRLTRTREKPVYLFLINAPLFFSYKWRVITPTAYRITDNILVCNGVFNRFCSEYD